jgi:hypothetical protein
MIIFLYIVPIIIIAIGAVALYGGLLHLIYLPLKRRLIKSGKLTDKLNRQIKQAFILLLCFLGVMIYLFITYRTPSEHRLEEISDINLPNDFQVLKDEYQDVMFKGYYIQYDIQLDKNVAEELIKNIRKSKFYNKNTFHKGARAENDFIEIDSAKAAWTKSPTGFDFKSEDGQTYYNIAFDTTTNVLKYEECGD